MADPAQTVMMVGMDSQPHNFQRAAQVGVEAALLRSAIQRGRAMEDRVRVVNQTSIVLIGKAKLRGCQIAAKDIDARAQTIFELWEIEMQLQGAPQAHLGLMGVFRADQDIQRIAISLQQVRGHMGADVSGMSWSARK